MFRTHTPIGYTKISNCRFVVNLFTPPRLRSIKPISEPDNQKKIDGKSVSTNIKEFADSLEFNSLIFTQNLKSSNADESSPAKKINDILNSRFDLRELSKNKRA
jgi:hypothetical protein